MRKLFIIGVGAGHPEHVTVQAIRALNAVDVFFSVDKGPEQSDLNRIRREICQTHVKDRTYRTVSIPDPARDRSPSSYRSAVTDWHVRRAGAFEKAIAQTLGEDECGAFLVWGDPSLYDSTLRIVRDILARGALQFAYEVIPGVSSVQALAAAHKITLNGIGGAVHITTGRKLAEQDPKGFDNVVVMLDADCAFRTVTAPDVEIYWGAYLGTKDEILVAGLLSEVGGEIERVRREARARKGWIFDIYLLRRASEG